LRQPPVNCKRLSQGCDSLFFAFELFLSSTVQPAFILCAAWFCALPVRAFTSYLLIPYREQEKKEVLKARKSSAQGNACGTDGGHQPSIPNGEESVCPDGVM
jgi:hypothetical protein